MLLRATADTALFVSGFFAESLPGGRGDVRYYASLGGRAYARLGREHEREDPAGTSVFDELAARFLQFVDVLAEVAEKTRLTTPAPVVRLYERWAATGSPRAAALLAEQGITPVAPSRERAPLSAPADAAHDRVGELAVDVQRRLEALYALDPEAPVTDYLVAAGEVGRTCPAGAAARSSRRRATR